MGQQASFPIVQCRVWRGQGQGRGRTQDKGRTLKGKKVHSGAAGRVEARAVAAADTAVSGSPPKAHTVVVSARSERGWTKENKAMLLGSCEGCMCRFGRGAIRHGAGAWRRAGSGRRKLRAREGPEQPRAFMVVRLCKTSGQQSAEWRRRHEIVVSAALLCSRTEATGGERRQREGAAPERRQEGCNRAQTGQGRAGQGRVLRQCTVIGVQSRHAHNMRRGVGGGVGGSQLGGCAAPRVRRGVIIMDERAAWAQIRKGRLGLETATHNTEGRATSRRPTKCGCTRWGRGCRLRLGGAAARRRVFVRW